MTLCEVNTCPVETPAQELVVVCTGFKQGSLKDLNCRFSNGATAPAQLDSETQRITCKLPQVDSRTRTKANTRVSLYRWLFSVCADAVFCSSDQVFMLSRMYLPRWRISSCSQARNTSWTASMARVARCCTGGATSCDHQQDILWHARRL